MSLLERFFSGAADAGPPDDEAAGRIRLVVGLGNPGPEYEGTRHNIGFDLVDRLASARGAKWEKSHKLRSKTASAADGLVLAKPLTFMNLSGNAVARLMRQQRLSPDRILVVYDDTALPPGGLRFRPGGSAGGHNGIKSIIEYLGTEEFPRLRLGIGPAPAQGALVDHVLGRFDDGERREMEKVLEIAEDGVNYALSSGLEAAMNRYNRKG
ncbi:MAG TPA: aminoacyl-tRNA hydrolase [Bacteroidia bacterium]|nr:aminoacyl-tRNA hydrolase [Bacteroidia bacterium]